MYKVSWREQKLLDHGYPTFCLTWATLSEEEMSWATYKIHNTINVLYMNHIMLKIFNLVRPQGRMQPVGHGLDTLVLDSFIYQTKTWFIHP